MSERDDALAALDDASATRRLRAARQLLDYAEASDREAITRQLRFEGDSWTQKALAKVLAKLRDDVIIEPVGEDGAGAEIEGVQAQALQLATRQVLHEVRPVIQSVETAGRSDLGLSFEGSAIEASLARLTQLLRAFQQLGDAASAPKIEQFNLTESISSLVDSLDLASPGVTVARTDAVVVSGDQGLIDLAIANLLRNAVEASAGTEVAVIVNWARRDDEAWVSVLDDGIGLPEDALSAATQVGTTTKGEGGHFGLGLPISLQAVESMSGSLNLIPRREGGTAAEIRWPQ